MIFELLSLWFALMGILFALYGLACFVAEVHRAPVVEKEQPPAAAENSPAGSDTRRQCPRAVAVDALGRYCFVCPDEPEDPTTATGVPYSTLHAPDTPPTTAARQ